MLKSGQCKMAMGMPPPSSIIGPIEIVRPPTSECIIGEVMVHALNTRKFGSLVLIEALRKRICEAFANNGDSGTYSAPWGLQLQH